MYPIEKLILEYLNGNNIKKSDLVNLFDYGNFNKNNRELDRIMGGNFDRQYMFTTYHIKNS